MIYFERSTGARRLVITAFKPVMILPSIVREVLVAVSRFPRLPNFFLPNLDNRRSHLSPCWQYIAGPHIRDTAWTVRLEASLRIDTFSASQKRDGKQSYLELRARRRCSCFYLPTTFLRPKGRFSRAKAPGTPSTGTDVCY